MSTENKPRDALVVNTHLSPETCDYPVRDVRVLALPNPNDHKLRGPIERTVLKLALLFVVCISLLLWLSLLPVWWFACARIVVVTAWHNVVSVFIHGAPVNRERFDRVIGFWPRGFAALVSITRDEGGHMDVEQQDFKTVLMETALAIVFFTTLFFTNELARSAASAGFSLGTLVWRLLVFLIRSFFL
jgi:hypothetical protein